MNKTSKSYILFEDVYYPLFDKMNKATDTIFENMDFRPQVETLYEQFVKSTHYQMLLEATSNLDKRYIVADWIMENVFGEAYYDVKYKLIIENESLPYNIEYKLNKSQEVLSEGVYTTAGSLAAATAGLSAAFFGGPILASIGIAVVGLAAIVGLSDTDRDAIVNGFRKVGEFIGKLVTLNFDILDLGTRKEILAAVSAESLADNLQECVKMTGWNPHESSKLTRFIDRILNNHKEYEYVQCVGTKLIQFYITTLEALYKILKATDVDDRIFQTMESSLKKGVLNETVFRNMARLVRNKNVYRVIDALNVTNDQLNNLIDKLTHSKDAEYSRIGHNLSKILDSELRNLAYKISKDLKHSEPKPALNRRNGTEGFTKDRNDRFGSTKPSFDSRNRSDSRNKNDSRNPF